MHLYILSQLIRYSNMNGCHVVYAERRIFVKGFSMKFSLDCTYYYFYLFLLVDHIIRRLYTRYKPRRLPWQHRGEYIPCLVLTFAINILRTFFTIVPVYYNVDFLIAHHVMIFISSIAIVKYYPNRTFLLDIVMSRLQGRIARKYES